MYSSKKLPMTLLPKVPGLTLEDLGIDTDMVSLSVASTRPSASCPVCDQTSAKLHSHYLRTLADLPWSGRAVRLLLRVRRFRYSSPECPRRIFAERLPDLVEPYARKTVRLYEDLELVGFALGGESGARLIARLGMAASPSTLVRYIRRATLVAERPSLTVIGIDDFALRRGYRYATIIVDLQSHEPIDLLPDREAQEIASWLKAHPQLEIISRDRGSSYAEGATEGAPQAVQVADRWHLLKNLGSALERFATRHSEQIKQAAKRAVQARGGEDSLIWAFSMSSMLRDTAQERESRERRQKRCDRYQKVMELYNQGVSQKAIAEELGMSRVTVNTYVHSEGFPERSTYHSPHRSILDPYSPYIHKRFSEGCQGARQLWREIKEMGYPGKGRMVRRYAVNLRKMLAGMSAEEQAEFLEASPNSLKAPSARRAAWWLTKPEEDLDVEQRAFVETLCLSSEEAKKAREIALKFKEMISERQVECLDDWLQAALEGGVRELESFARTLSWDYEAVAAALKYEWSQGQVEGQINRLKLIKKQMYGRANFDLLRQRVLGAA